MNLAGIQASREDLRGHTLISYHVINILSWATAQIHDPASLSLSTTLRPFLGVGRSVHGTARTAGRSSGLHPQRSQPRANLHLHRHRAYTALVDPPPARPGDKWLFVQIIPHLISVIHHRIDLSSSRLFIVRFQFVYLPWLACDIIADAIHGVPFSLPQYLALILISL